MARASLNRLVADTTPEVVVKDLLWSAAPNLDDTSSAAGRGTQSGTGSSL